MNFPAMESLEARAMLSGMSPAGLRHVLDIGPGQGAGATVAIVDAYNDPTIAADLAHYSRHYGLPRPDLTVVNLGAAGNTGGETEWSVEMALDAETVHAVAPGAHIVLVEAASASLADLAIAEQYAASIPGVDAISNSWGSPGDPYDTFYDVSYDEAFGADKGIVYAFAAGDSSGPISYPADQPDVLSVGGTVANGHGHRQPWLQYDADPDVRLPGGPPGLEVFGSSGFGKPTWTNAWGTSLACPAFVAEIADVDAEMGQTVTTAQVLAAVPQGAEPTEADLMEWLS